MKIAIAQTYLEVLFGAAMRAAATTLLLLVLGALAVVYQARKEEKSIDIITLLRGG